jgi:multidrug efflux system membrane fusion protein
MQRKTLTAIASLLLIVAGAFVWFWSTRTVAEPAQPALAPVPVVAATVTQHDVPIYLTGVGTVVAYNTVVVRSQIQGQITSINFTEGQSVRTGDLLAQIDPRPYQAQLDQATATRDRDQAQLVNAQANQKRYADLGNKGWATPQLVETQNAQVAQLQSAIKADEALMESANVLLSYTRLTSPISGITGIRQVDIGNIIHPTDPNGLVVVTQIEPISLLFTLPETDLPRIQDEEAKSKEPLKVLAYSQDDTIKLDEGTLGLINNQIVQTTGSIQLKANFPNVAHRLWPGELVNVKLQVEIRTGALTVPASVVQQGPDGAFAYVINADQTVEQALVTSGLKANEQVVSDGQYKLRAGVRVTVLHGRAAQEAAAQSAQQAPIP